MGLGGVQALRDIVKEVNESGTKDKIGGVAPTQYIAEKPIHDAGGKIVRVEEGHADPRNPHSWPHINYRTGSDKRAAIQIEEVVRPYP